MCNGSPIDPLVAGAFCVQDLGKAFFFSTEQRKENRFIIMPGMMAGIFSTSCPYLCGKLVCIPIIFELNFVFILIFVNV